MGRHHRQQARPIITLFAKSDALGLPRREAPIVTLVLAAALSLSGSVRALEPAGGVPTSESRTRGSTYEILRERVRTEPIKELTDPMFPEFLFTGRRHSGLLTIGVDLHDPANPSTLETNFADWNLAARASLLLAYARLITEPDTTERFVGLPAEQVRSMRATEAANRVRITQIVRSGGYEASWQPFVAAYRKLLQAAETRMPPGDTAIGDVKTLAIVGHLARELGVYRLVRELRIEPGEVASEIVRLVDTWRAKRGLPTEPTDHASNLFYVCDSGEATAVRIHSWHRLAPAFFQAWEAADKKLDDPQAVLMMTMFDGINKDIHAWALAHRDADSGRIDRVVNEMAKTRGLYSLLEK